MTTLRVVHQKTRDVRPWVVRKSGVNRSHHDTKRKAVNEAKSFGKALSNNQSNDVVLKIEKKNGTLQDTITYEGSKSDVLI